MYKFVSNMIIMLHRLIYYGLPTLVCSLYPYMCCLYCSGMREPCNKSKPRPVLRRDSGSGKLKQRSEMAIHCRLSAQYGFSWIVGVVIIILGVTYTEDQAVCYTLHILNLIFNVLYGCTGLFIFFAFLVNKRILHLYKARFSSKRFPHYKSSKSNSAFSQSWQVSTISSKVSSPTSPIEEEPDVSADNNNIDNTKVSHGSINVAFVDHL